MDTAWHSKEPEQILAELKVGPDGLDEQEAKKRIEEYGYNELTEKKGKVSVTRGKLLVIKAKD